MAIDTQHGVVLTAVPGSWTGNLEDVTLHTETIEVVDTSHHGDSAFMTKLAGDLKDAGEVSLVVQFEGDTALPAAGTTGTLTLTDATATGETTPANWSGTAIVTSVDHGTRNKNSNELKKATITLTWDGETGPSFTAAT